MYDNSILGLVLVINHVYTKETNHHFIIGSSDCMSKKHLRGIADYLISMQKRSSRRLLENKRLGVEVKHHGDELPGVGFTMVLFLWLKKHVPCVKLIEEDLRVANLVGEC